MVELQFYKLQIIIIVILIVRNRIDWLINSVDMLQSEIKIVELRFHKLQRIIIIYFDYLLLMLACNSALEAAIWIFNKPIPIPIVTIIHWPINYMLQSEYMQMFVQVVLLLLLLLLNKLLYNLFAWIFTQYCVINRSFVLLIHNFSKFLAPDNDFPAFWLVP